VLTFLAVAAIGVGLWLVLDDIARRRTVEWFQDAYHALRRTGGENTVAKQRGTDPAGGPNSRPSAHTGKATHPKPESKPAENALLPPPPATETSPSPATREGVSASGTKPVSATAPAAVATKAGPTEFPFTAPDGQPDQVVPATAPAPPPAPPPDTEALTQKARSLYNQALAAQGNRDYREAVRLYEQVKATFPREVWPTDLEVKLRLARGQLK
jgi:hypothetical protein